MTKSTFIKIAGFAVLVAASFGLASCDTIQNSQDGDLSEFRVPQGFTFATTENVTVNVRAAQIDAERTLIRIYDGNPVLGGNIVREVTLNAGQSRAVALNVGGHVRDNLWILSVLPNGLMSAHPVHFSGSSAQVDVVTIQDEDASGSAQQRVTGAAGADLNFVSSAQQAHAILNNTPGVVENDFELASRNAYQNMCWVFSGTQINGGSNAISGGHSLNTLNGGVNDETFPHSLISPWVEFDGTGTISFIAAASANNNNVGLSLFFVDEFGNPQTANPLYTHSFSGNSANQVVSATVEIPSDLVGIGRLMWNFTGTRPNIRGILDDIVIQAQNASDVVNGCVPMGGVRSQTEFVNHYPGEGVFGTLAFEDNWPGFGDYDMNDLVVGYNIREITNENDQIIRIEMTHKIRAIGGVLRTGFGYQFPFNPDAIQSVTGQRLSTGKVTNLPSGAEAGQDRAVVILWDNSTENMPTFSNVIRGRFNEYDVMESVITLTVPLERSQVGSAPYNPFIFIHGTRNGEPFGGRGHEVHLKGMPPTSLADTSLFGTASDITDPMRGIFYTSREGLNWAINVPVPLVHPLSQVPITEAFTNFKPWATSGGTVSRDWFVDRSDNLREDKVFRRPGNE